MRGRFFIVGLAVLAVAVAYISRPEEGAGGKAVTAGQHALHVPFFYSTEKTALMAMLVNRFNARRERVDGRPVFIDGTAIASGEAESAIAHSTLQPTAWSPASSLWGGLLNYDADRTWAPAGSRSLMRTPLVIAMWEPMARALGWPAKQSGFSDLLRLARARTGFAAYGHPELGPFKLVHTNPDFSTSGLSAVAAEYVAATGKPANKLTPADIVAARPVVRRLERSITHYGDQTPTVAAQMRAEGPTYASAGAMEETTLLDSNHRRPRGQPRLVALYPTEGTFSSDNPFYILKSPWVRPDQARGAQAFRRFLERELTPELAGRFFFRPAGTAAPSSEISTAEGADPEQPSRVLKPPAPSVLAAIRRAWQLDRKPANVLLVVDVSQSMADEHRLENAKAGLLAFLANVQPQDNVGLMSFSSEVYPLVPVGPVRRQLPRLRQAVAALKPDAGTAFYDGTAAALGDMVALPDRKDHINAVVVLTDGDDTSSRRVTERQLIDRLAGDQETPDRVRVYTIAYQPQPSFKAVLDRVAAAGGGRPFQGTTGNIESIYTNVSSFF